MGAVRETGGVSTARNRQVGDGSNESGAMKGLGKPCAGERHARFDERGLETGYGLGTAAPAARCMDSAGPIDYRASPRLYPEPPLFSSSADARQLRPQRFSFQVHLDSFSNSHRPSSLRQATPASLAHS